MRRWPTVALVAALAVSALTACQPAPAPPPRPIFIKATVDPTGCRPPADQFGGRWLITFHANGIYRIVAHGYAPTLWDSEFPGSQLAFEIPAVTGWWVQEYPATQVSVVTDYIPKTPCGSPV